MSEQKRIVTATDAHDVAECVWVFARADETIEIVRQGSPGGRIRLTVRQRGVEGAVHEFDDRLACATSQSRIEEGLVAQGYHLHAFSLERRSGRDRRGESRGPDRRRS